MANALSGIGTRTTDKKTVSTIVTANLFTVTGTVRVLAIVGRITTAIEAAANNTKLTFTPTGGAATDLCAVLNLTGSAIRKFLSITGTKANALVLSADAGIIVGAQATNLILGPGVIAMDCAGDTDGVIDWHVIYEPMTPTDSTIEAA